MAEKIRLTVVIEYEPNLDHYPGCTTVAQAATFDELENPFTEYPDAYLNDSDIKSVTFEAVTTD
ncbi:hypothetical protein HKX69_05680 [Streptomyces argyrophyllae]|uniref:Uncharacterized protein n=1 Tax=Streptomyces argyrophylli TaxID=2726118 RepID=A0A6M4PFQ3_9ACTN|nr:hypothetical protein [Streptomyces argyrophyllae]QJS09073.1 hypothetical protein HKX69_05680 [Streptomyces argyrophyllae]